MDEETRAIYFIVTGQYAAVRYEADNFVVHSNTYHIHGSLFSLTYDEDKIVYNNAYVGQLSSHPDYRDNVFYICRDSQYLSQSGLWTDSTADALIVQLDPTGDGDVTTLPTLSTHIVSASNPISADGIDLFLPDKWFALYAVRGDCLWFGDASEFESQLFFGGEPYSIGIPFQLSENEGKIRIRSKDGRFLGVMMSPNCFDYMDQECQQQHNASSRCSRCMGNYSIGYHSDPQDCFTLIPRGLPSMFVLYDGAYYYGVDVLKSSFAAVNRVERIEEATTFQFVG